MSLTCLDPQHVRDGTRPQCRFEMSLVITRSRSDSTYTNPCRFLFNCGLSSACMGQRTQGMDNLGASEREQTSIIIQEEGIHKMNQIDNACIHINTHFLTSLHKKEIGHWSRLA